MKRSNECTPPGKRFSNWVRAAARVMFRFRRPCNPAAPTEMDQLRAWFQKHPPGAAAQPGGTLRALQAASDRSLRKGS